MALRLTWIAITLLLLAGRGVQARADSAVLELAFSGPPYIPIGATVTCEFWMEFSCEPDVPPATSYQAFLEFATDTLEFVSGEYTLDAFGLPLIMPIEDSDGTLDLAAGLNTFSGQEPVCGWHLLATLEFTAIADGEVCSSLFFRDHYPPTSIMDVDVVRIIPLLVSTSAVGDVNGDDVIDMADVNAAVQVLLVPDDATPEERAAVNANCDAVVDGRDIQPLVDLWLSLL